MTLLNLESCHTCLMASLLFRLLDNALQPLPNTGILVDGLRKRTDNFGDVTREPNLDS
jgi:hypothetical protein